MDTVHSNGNAASSLPATPLRRQFDLTNTFFRKPIQSYKYSFSFTDILVILADLPLMNHLLALFPNLYLHRRYLSDCRLDIRAKVP